MLHLLTPDAVYESLFAVNLDALAISGIRGLIVDLDNTLVAYGDTDASARARTWMHDVQDQGFHVCITSNARSARVRLFASQFGVPAIANAAKPVRRPFLRAMRLLGTASSETAVIGDQMFTDVLGGNRSGTYTILVNPLSSTELGATRVMRRLERKVLKRLVRCGMLDEAAWATRRRPK